MKTYTCTTCGKLFERNPSANQRIKSANVYCSRSCAAKRQQRALPDLKCKQCGKVFYRKPSERKLNNNFCSRLCANQAQSRTLQDMPKLRMVQGVEKKCQNCGNTFFVKPHRSANAKYCSRACFYATRYGTASGKTGKSEKGSRNGNFKGTNNRTTARLNAAKYFGNKCMICGWDEIVDVHHIIPRRHNGSNNLDNLIVLCPNHHRMADLGRIATDELLKITRAAIALLPGPLPQFDQSQCALPETSLQPLLFVVPAQTNQSD